MKTTKTQKATTSNSYSSKPFFNKSGEGSFFSQTKESEIPFFNPHPIQTKLTVGQPNDKYEQEADMTAEKVAQKLETPNPSTPIQRKGEKCEQEKLQKKEEDTEEHEVMRKPIFESDGDSQIRTKSIENQLNSSKGDGRPLSEDTRPDMESAFGTDFSSVKVHTDSNAIRMNQTLGAQAFTHGNHIFFNEGKYNPQSKEGKHLLAHELTHTIQQRNSSQTNRVSLKRDPNAEDKIQLTKFQVYKATLEAKREETMRGIQERVDSQMPGIEENLAKDDLSETDREMLERYKADRYATWEKWIKDIDDAIKFVEYEEFTYRWTLENRASEHDKIVWHSSGILAGWIRESESHAIREIESSAAYQMGVRHGTFFAKLRSEGSSLEDAVLKTIGLGVLDITGASGLVEGISGYDIATGRELSTAERVVKGVVGAISVASIISMGGPRLANWAKSISPGNLRVMQMAPAGGISGVMLAAEGGAVIALTQAEIITLVGAGVLNVSVMHMATGTSGGGTPSSVSGLTGAHRGAPRGGGGNATAKTYAEKVNKANGSNPPDQSVYVNGVEFDGHNPTSKNLLDAKYSKGKGSWYDVSGSSSFTTNVKIPEILKQARRQLNGMKGSGASGIEWHISDADVVKQIQTLFRKEGINIIVKHTSQ